MTFGTHVRQDLSTRFKTGSLTFSKVICFVGSTFPIYCTTKVQHYLSVYPHVALKLGECQVILRASGQSFTRKRRFNQYKIYVMFKFLHGIHSLRPRTVYWNMGMLNDLPKTNSGMPLFSSVCTYDQSRPFHPCLISRNSQKASIIVSNTY